MIEYKRCSEVEDLVTYEAFKAGFVDYIIKLDIPFDAFIKRFFGPEGNGREHSFIALTDGRPIGVLLGGIRDFGGRRTMRCGGMCVVPEFRMRGVSVGLFELHREEALKNNCQQLLLEVITHNLPALRFYKRLGYQRIYDLHYYLLESTEGFMQRWARSGDVDYQLDKILFSDLKSLREKSDVHINWQNECEAIGCLANQYHYGVMVNGLCVAGLSINQTGQFHFLYVLPEWRAKGMAAALLAHSAQELKLEKIKTGFPNNANLHFFLLGVGFKQEKIQQYEMYMPL